ncbi:hypothetical protein FRB99_003387, partial [Tulasnella sp. 403]
MLHMFLTNELMTFVPYDPNQGSPVPQLGSDAYVSIVTSVHLAGVAQTADPTVFTGSPVTQQGPLFHPSPPNTVPSSPVPSTPSPLPVPSPLAQEDALGQLRLDSFNMTSNLIAEQQVKTKTAVTYKHHVAAFIDHEHKRGKRKRDGSGYEEGTTVGKYTIMGIISALEDRCYQDQHLYPNDPEASIPLCSDPRVSKQEQMAKKNEPERVKKAQALKAAGSTA